MPLTTPQAIVSFSLRAIGVLGVGQTALAEDYQDAFDALNGMIGQWGVDRGMIYHEVTESVTSTGATSYTVGPGGDFDVARPSRLEFAFTRQLFSGPPNQVDYPLQILQSREDYDRITLKSLTSFATHIFYDSAFPLGAVYPWPIPTSDQYEIHITLKAHLAQFDSYVQSLNLPPEYTEVLWSNLAIRLAAIYPGSVLTPATQAIAKASVSRVFMANAQIPRLMMPTGLVRPRLYNIYSGQTY